MLKQGRWTDNPQGKTKFLLRNFESSVSESTRLDSNAFVSREVSCEHPFKKYVRKCYSCNRFPTAGDWRTARIAWCSRDFTVPRGNPS